MFTINNEGLISSSCGATNDASFCGQLKYCFINSETGEEIISWPEKEVTYVVAANQPTLKSLAGDATGLKKILVRIYRTSLKDVVREVEIQFLIKPKKVPEHSLKGIKVEVLIETAKIVNIVE